MKLQSANGLKEKINDGRMVTLRLQWCQLTAQESQPLGDEVLQMAREVFGEQTMLYLGKVNQKRRCEKLFKHLPWRQNRNFYLTLNGFVRTEEKLSVQKERCTNGLISQQEHIFNPKKTRSHPLYPTTAEEGVALIKRMYQANITDYSSDAFPIETIFEVERLYCGNGRYRLEVRISISAYAIQYNISQLLEQYKVYLRHFSENRGLYAGYLYYETKTRGAHERYHICPRKKNDIFDSGEYLLGYEWAAYLCNDLAGKMTKDGLALLEAHADITKVKTGFYYQIRCDLPAYGLEEKKICNRIFYDMLKKGYYFIPAYFSYLQKIQPVKESVYLLRIKEETSGLKNPHYYIGFFHDFAMENSVIPENFDIIQEVTLKD